MMSEDEDSPLAKRYKSDTTSDLEISPVLTDSYQEKSFDSQDTKVFERKLIFVHFYFYSNFIQRFLMIQFMVQLNYIGYLLN